MPETPNRPIAHLVVSVPNQVSASHLLCLPRVVLLHQGKSISCLAIGKVMQLNANGREANTGTDMGSSQAKAHWY